MEVRYLNKLKDFPNAQEKNCIKKGELREKGWGVREKDHPNGL